MNWETFNQTLTTRFGTDYAAGGGTFPVSYDGSKRNNSATSWIHFSWIGGEPTASVTLRREKHPVILFAQIFGPPDNGRKALFEQAKIVADLWRAQRYAIESNGAGGGLNLLPLDGGESNHDRLGRRAQASLSSRDAGSLGIKRAGASECAMRRRARCRLPKPGLILNIDTDTRER